MLTKKEIDYELGVHDCGQNPDCERYRGCSGKGRPIPSDKDLEELEVLYKENCLEILKNSKINEDVETTIKRWFKEHWEIHYKK